MATLIRAMLLGWVLWVGNSEILIHIHGYETKERCVADYKKFFDPFPYECLKEGIKPTV